MLITSSSVSTPETLATYRTACAARRAGISVVPILPDGSKRPALSWKRYQHRRPTVNELTRWFPHSEYGIAFIMGAISGGLETLDFDTREIYQFWRERMHDEGWGALHDRLAAGYLEASPGGMHLLYRCPSVESNQRLAAVPVEGPQHSRTLIETRGEGGLVVVAPSCGEVHPSGKPYVLLQGGIATIQTITAAERQTLFVIARSFNKTPPPQIYTGSSKPALLRPSDANLRPGDDYNRRVSWEGVLEPHGWTLLYMRDGEGYWQRPGKEGPGVSATTNYADSDLLYVFSTSTEFDVGRSYSKFAAYTLLEHGGDFAAAAKTLVRLGYGGGLVERG
ncbi:MAG TPA: bifunctional DNA primase/polymerase [Ktedonobacteraceae bacterium]|nr:bifunctional DNA primase/polymerase [Ktedonobacteraceae bacterium]